MKWKYLIAEYDPKAGQIRTLRNRAWHSIHEAGDLGWELVETTWADEEYPYATFKKPVLEADVPESLKEKGDSMQARQDKLQIAMVRLANEWKERAEEARAKCLSTALPHHIPYQVSLTKKDVYSQCARELIEAIGNAYESREPIVEAEETLKGSEAFKTTALYFVYMSGAEAFDEGENILANPYDWMSERHDVRACAKVWTQGYDDQRTIFKKSKAEAEEADEEVDVQQTLVEAYAEGYQAYTDYKLFAVCPYDTGTQQREQWYKGYHRNQEEQELKHLKDFTGKSMAYMTSWDCGYYSPGAIHNPFLWEKRLDRTSWEVGESNGCMARRLADKLGVGPFQQESRPSTYWRAGYDAGNAPFAEGTPNPHPPTYARAHCDWATGFVAGQKEWKESCNSLRESLRQEEREEEPRRYRCSSPGCDAVRTGVNAIVHHLRLQHSSFNPVCGLEYEEEAEQPHAPNADLRECERVGDDNKEPQEKLVNLWVLYKRLDSGCETCSSPLQVTTDQQKAVDWVSEDWPHNFALPFVIAVEQPAEPHRVWTLLYTPNSGISYEVPRGITTVESEVLEWYTRGPGFRTQEYAL